jgi:hypothetical protein
VFLRRLRRGKSSAPATAVSTRAAIVEERIENGAPPPARPGAERFPAAAKRAVVSC